MSLATFITNAVIKVSTDEMYASMPFATREEARAQFVAALLFELGLGPSPVAVHAPVAEPKEEKKEEEKKPRKPKAKAEEPKVEEAGQLAIAETKPVEEVKVVEVKEKKPRKPKAKDEPAPATEAPVANAGAEPAKVEEVNEKKKPGPKPKAKPVAEGPVNIDKLTPTHKKHLKKIADELKVELNDKEFLAYANGISAEEWGVKALDDHIRAFLTPTPIPLAPPPKEFVVVEFPKDSGKEYLVDPETKIVYEMVADDAPVRNPLGVVGQLEFKDMEFSTDNSTA